MLEQLINSLKSEVGGQLANQSNLQSGHMDQIFSIISNVARSEVAGQILKGNIDVALNVLTA
jgi:hypothetical protein